MDCKYLVKYRWVNPMTNREFIGERMTTRDENGNFRLWDGAEVLDSVEVDNIWPDESRIDIISQNGNDGIHYGVEE